MSGAVLHTRDLSAGYGGAPIVSGVSLSAEAGRVLTLIGPNGAGKSTLLKTLVRELPPVAGAVYLDGRDLSALPGRAVARSVAAVLTGRPRPELMTCWDVAAAGRYPYTGLFGALSEDDRRAVQESMALVGVAELAERPFDRVSDGQRQLVLLARALCQDPHVLVLDEPTSFLDIRHKLAFLNALRTLVRERNVAAVLSLHELELARRYSDTLFCVKDGRVDRAGGPEEIFSSDGGAYIDALYGMEAGSYAALFG